MNHLLNMVPNLLQNGFRQSKFCRIKYKAAQPVLLFYIIFVLQYSHMSLSDEKIKSLELTANNVRMSIIDMLQDAGSGHTAGPLGMADIFTALYFHIAKHDPKNPEWTDRDRIILSNGHIVPVRYATMAHAGYFPLDELKTLRKFGSRLQGHPERHMMP